MMKLAFQALALRQSEFRSNGESTLHGFQFPLGRNHAQNASFTVYGGNLILFYTQFWFHFFTDSDMVAEFLLKLNLSFLT